MGMSDYRNKTLLQNAIVAVTVFNIFTCFVAKSFVPPPFSLMHGKISGGERQQSIALMSKLKIMVLR